MSDIQLFRLVQGTAESHDVEHDCRTVIGVVVDDLHAADLLNVLTGARQRHRQQVVRKPRVDAIDEDGRRSLAGGVLDGAKPPRPH